MSTFTLLSTDKYVEQSVTGHLKTMIHFSHEVSLHLDLRTVTRMLLNGRDFNAMQFIVCYRCR